MRDINQMIHHLKHVRPDLSSVEVPALSDNLLSYDW